MPTDERPPDATAGIALPPDLASVTALNAWFDRLADDLGLPKDTAHDVKLCLNEAVTNAIVHGLGGVPGGRVSVELERWPDRTRVRIRDTGVPFNPLDAPRHVPAEDILSAKIGGLGIAIMRETSSSAEYRHAEGENILTLSFLDAQDGPR